MQTLSSSFPRLGVLLSIILLHCITSTAHAQNGRIEGHVTDAETGESLANASIIVNRTSIATKTDRMGAFLLKEIPSGSYTLTASIVGYESMNRVVTVTQGDATSVSFALVTQAVNAPQVSVSADRSRSYIATIARTATKTSTPLRDVPASIQVVPEIVLKDQGATDVDQSIRNVSGITQSSQSNYGFFNNYVVRGLRQRFLRDGVPDGPTTNGYARTLTAVERVEVLKGPGSAIYGSSEPGGTINLVSKPAYLQPTLVIAQSIGSFGATRTSIDAGRSLFDDDLRSRISVAYSRKDGFRNIENKSVEVLPSLTYTPSKDHTITASLDYRNIDQDADTYGILFRGNTVLDVPVETDYHTPFSTTSQKIIRGAVSHSWQASEGTSIRTNIVLMNRDLYLLRNAGGTITATSDTMSARRLREQTDNANDLIAQIEPSFVIQTGPIDHTLLSGVEYQRSSILAMRQTANLPDIVNILAPVARETSRDSLKFKVDFDRDIHINQFGAYLQDQLTLTEQIKARVGVRFDQFNVDDIHKNDTLGDTRSDGRISTQAGLVYQPITQLSLYGGVARGHLSTVSTESARISEPESSTQYEFGAKASLLEGHLQINTAAFDVTREHFNITIGTEQIPVGEQRTRGLELDIAAQPSKAWGITGNYAYNDAVLTNNPSDTGSVGKRPVGVPQQTASLWSTYKFQSGVLEGFGFGGGLTFRDAIFLDAHNTRSLPSYLIADMTILYHTESFEAQINMTNIGDLLYYRNGLNSGALPGDPRSVQGMIRVNL